MSSLAKQRIISFMMVLGVFGFLFLKPMEASARTVLRQFFGFLDTPVGRLFPIASYKGTFYFEKPVENQNTNFSLARHEGFLTFPMWQDPKHELSWFIFVRGSTFDTEAIFPVVDEPFPQSLWDIRFGPNYRQVLNNGWTVGGNFFFGTASDEPFTSTDDLEYIANFYMRLPTKNKKDAWVVLLNYSNNREFLNNIPLPGFGYWFGSLEWFKGLVGLPLMGFQFKPHKTVNLGFFYFPARNIIAELGYEPFTFLRFYTYFQWYNERYFPLDRSDTRDRLFYYEKRVAGGVRIRPAVWAEIKFESGYTWDRFYFVGRNYGDRFDDRVGVNNGPMLMGNITFLFWKGPKRNRKSDVEQLLPLVADGGTKFNWFPQ